MAIHRPHPQPLPPSWPGDQLHASCCCSSVHLTAQGAASCRQRGGWGRQCDAPLYITDRYRTRPERERHGRRSTSNFSDAQPGWLCGRCGQVEGRAGGGLTALLVWRSTQGLIAVPNTCSLCSWCPAAAAADLGSCSAPGGAAAQVQPVHGHTAAPGLCRRRRLGRRQRAAPRGHLLGKCLAWAGLGLLPARLAAVVLLKARMQACFAQPAAALDAALDLSRRAAINSRADEHASTQAGASNTSSNSRRVC
jgi:hypothetical protein